MKTLRKERFSMRLLKAMHELERFSSTEQSIIRYILQHPSEIADLTTRELAEKTYTSPAAVSRLSQKLGLKGYNEFKIKFISEINRVAADGKGIVRRPVTEKDKPDDIVRKIAAIEIEAIEETKNEMDLDQLARVAQLLQEASSIDFYAYDQNFSLAEMATYNFLQIQRPTTCYNAMNSQFSLALNSDKTHIAIIISRTGENRRLIRTAKILRKRSVPTIVLSCSPETTLARCCQEFLYVANTEEYLDFGGMIFSIGVRYYIDVLFSMLLARDYNLLEHHYQELEANLGKISDEAERRLW